MKLVRYFQAMLEQAIRRKIEELVRRAPAISSEARRTVASLGAGEGWITEAVNVIEVAIPIESKKSIRRMVETIHELTVQSGHGRTPHSWSTS